MTAPRCHILSPQEAPRHLPSGRGGRDKPRRFGAGWWLLVRISQHLDHYGRNSSATAPGGRDGPTGRDGSRQGNFDISTPTGRSILPSSASHGCFIMYFVVVPMSMSQGYGKGLQTCFLPWAAREEMRQEVSGANRWTKRAGLILLLSLCLEAVSGFRLASPGAGRVPVRRTPRWQSSPFSRREVSASAVPSV